MGVKKAKRGAIDLNKVALGDDESHVEGVEHEKEGHELDAIVSASSSAFLTLGMLLKPFLEVLTTSTLAWTRWSTSKMRSLSKLSNCRSFSISIFGVPIYHFLLFDLVIA